jgi:DNA (cytosine-5)-methyltransferase 1
VIEPRLLDLFCGAGGAAAGYAAAGFRVIGVDKNPQPNYPYEFLRDDALAVLAEPDVLASYAAIHASPTCQRKARVTAWRGSRESHPNTLTPTLNALRALPDVPWVVENVPEAEDELRPDYRLCGTQFGLRVKRHRSFEIGNWAGFELLPPCQCYRNPRLIPFEHKDERAFADAMGCAWMTNLEGRQAIPPAFTEHIGRQLMADLVHTAATAGGVR